MIRFTGPTNNSFENTLNYMLNYNEVIDEIIRQEDSYIVNFHGTNKILNNLYKTLDMHSEARLILDSNTFYTITFININKLKPINIKNKPWVINAPFNLYPCLLYKGYVNVDYIFELTEWHIMMSKL